jgi:hypothetical protein
MSWRVPEGGVGFSHRLWYALLRGAIKRSCKSSDLIACLIFHHCFFLDR